MVAVGERIADYEVLAKLGEGGMATLFLGRRVGIQGFSRPVAIKVVHSRLNDDPEFVNMFIDEANISARIVHPNVVHVEELGKEDEHYFLVMEYIDGCSLSQLLRALKAANLRLNATSAVSIVAAVAAALDAAHTTVGDDGLALGIVHRDVSPQNILLSYQGHTKLIDFGIAKAHGRLAETQTTAIKGKLRYMAPEQARGTSVDQRTDIYALGVILWELLTGRRMFAGKDNMEVLAQANDRTIEAPFAINPRVSSQLSAVVMKAIESSPDARPQTAREWRAQLLEAQPSARSVDPMVLSHFLQDMMSDLIDQQREKFGSISGVTTIAFQDAERNDASGAHRIRAKRATDTLTEAILADGPTLPSATRPKRADKAPLFVAVAVVCIAAVIGAWASHGDVTEIAPVSAPAATPAGAARTPMYAAPAVPVQLPLAEPEPVEIETDVDAVELVPRTPRARPPRRRRTEMRTPVPPSAEMQPTEPDEAAPPLPQPTTAVSMETPPGSIVNDFDL